MNTLLDKLKALPPYKVRLQARHKGKRRPLTNLEIKERSGLALETVRRVSHLQSWNSVTVETMLRFCAACGVEMLNQKRVLQFVRQTNGLRSASHLRWSDDHSHNKKYFDRIAAYGVQISTAGSGTC